MLLKFKSVALQEVRTVAFFLQQFILTEVAQLNPDAEYNRFKVRSLDRLPPVLFIL